MSRARSLRERLLTWLLIPVLGALAISAVVAYSLALRTANLVYDRWLLDSAVSLARLVRVDRGRLQVDLPNAAMQILEFDKDDKIYYNVRGPSGDLLAGYGGLPSTSDADPSPERPEHYYNATYQGTPVRVVSIRLPVQGLAPGETVQVAIAETLVKRQTLVLEVFWETLAPQLLLLCIAAPAVWFGVARGLLPLAALRAQITSRSHRDLSPVAEELSPPEVRPLVHAINDLLERLRVAIEAQKRFVADAAHQLRTPLAGLKTQAELALRRPDPDTVQQSLLQIKTASERSSHLVNQLLAMARAEPGGRAVSFERIDLASIARAVTVQWIPAAVHKNIDLGYESASRDASALGDPMMVRELLSNLIDNAVRYTQRGGHVTVTVASAHQRVTVSVTDDGPGIPDAEHERVFERFHRVLGTDQDGCGLGLAIVREIADRHAAEVEIGTGLGRRGTRIAVAFPNAREAR